VTPRSLEPDVKGIVSKVVAGEADAGIVYSTDVKAAGDGALGVKIPTSGTSSRPIRSPQVRTTQNTRRWAGIHELPRFERGSADARSYGFTAI